GLGLGDAMLGEDAGVHLRLPVLALSPAHEIVGSITGEVFYGLHAILAQRDQHGGGDAGNLAQLVLDAQLLAGGVLLGLDFLEIFAGAVLDFSGGVLIETINGGDFGRVDIGNFLDGREAFRRKDL